MRVSSRFLLEISAAFIFSMLSSQASELVSVVAIAGNMRLVQARAPYTIQYAVANHSTRPIILQPQSSSLVRPGAECGISDYTKGPLLPGKAGTISIRCEWSSFGEAQSYRRTEFSVETIPFGLVTFAVTAEVFDPARSTMDADTCEARKSLNCDGRPKRVRRLCFFGQAFLEVIGGSVHLMELCPEAYFERDEVSSVSDIRRRLADILENTCDKVEAITVLDHGAPGVQSVTPIEESVNKTEALNLRGLSGVFENGRYECMLTNPARLIFGGCSVGKGCKGRIFMAAAGRALSPTKSVEVTAADTSTEGGLSRITSRTGSRNGRDVVVFENPSSEKWFFRGLRSGSTQAIGPYCANEVNAYLENAQTKIEALVSKGCPVSPDAPEHAITILKTIGQQLVRLPPTALSTDVQKIVYLGRYEYLFDQMSFLNKFFSLANEACEKK